MRCSLVAVVRRVSGTFLLLVNFLRSMTLHIGSMCRETSSGVFGLFKKIAHDGVVFSKFAVAGDQPKNFVREAGHGGESFDFLIREARRLQHGALHNLVRVANQRAPRLGSAFDRELHALRNAHLGETHEAASDRLATSGSASAAASASAASSMAEPSSSWS